MGSYYLIKREQFIVLGLFDEDYFVYLEDLDFSYRVKKNNSIVFFNTDIEIYHETGGTSKNVKAQRLFYSLDSLLIYGKKHFSKASYFILFFLVFLIEPLSRILFNLIGLNFKGIIETILGYKMLYIKYFL
jgi:GT2 family glycosyltransferase